MFMTAPWEVSVVCRKPCTQGAPLARFTERSTPQRGRSADMRRYGQVIGLKPDAVARYEALHADVWPEVLATIARCNIRNYSIFRRGTTLFAYFEYTGTNFALDMATMGADPKTQEWWKLTEPLQEPCASREPGEWWANATEIFHTD
jgi:L-rhamnose mutarotase